MPHPSNPEQYSRKAWRRLMIGAGLLFGSLFIATTVAVLAAYEYWLATGLICYRRTLLAALLGLGTIAGLTMLAFAWHRLVRHSHFLAATARLAAVPLAPTVAKHAAALGLDGRVTAFASPVPAAFVSGLRRPHIYVSTALIAALDEGEMLAVLRHEARHLERRDPWRQAFAQAFAEAFGAPWWRFPSIARLCREFQLAMELDADAAAASGPAERWHLASALVKVLRAAGTAAGRYGDDAGGSGGVRPDDAGGSGGSGGVRPLAGAVASLDGMAAVRLAQLTGRPLPAAASASPAERRATAVTLAWLVAVVALWWCPAVMGTLF